jgi:FolB domain-containing protein
MLRTIIGANAWERKQKQDVVINITVDFDPRKAAKTDNVENTLDYKKIKRKVIDIVEKSRCRLVEALTAKVLREIMKNPMALAAGVCIDKPHALRFAESVSIEMKADKKM